jgi:ketosteroid isomerase-like protein
MSLPSMEEMLEIVRRGYDAFNRADVDAFCALATADVEIHDLPYMPETETFCGREGVERYFAMNWELWEHVWGEVDQTIAAGPDRVLALARHGGKTRGGPEVVQARGVLVTFSDAGKIREVRFFADQGEARAAAGVNEHTSA